jgi:tetratricopeptide (TPR) repeat protein
VPEEREPPQAGRPFPASVQVAYRYSPAVHQVPYRVIAPQGDPRECYERGSASRERKRFAEALAAFDEAIALRPDYAEAHNSRGIVLASLERLEDALAAFDRAIEHKPDYAEAHNNRAIVLHDLKRLDAAVESYDKALSLQLDNARVHSNRGVVLGELQRRDEAIASYDKAIALQPDYAEAYYNRAMMLHELKRFDEALGNFTQAIALKPDYAEAYNNRGVLLQDLKRIDEALADFDRAMALMPDFAEVYCNKAYCLLLTGRFEEGWRLHEWRKKTAKPVGAEMFPQPLWLGSEDVANKAVFVHPEQGFGDTIQFSRYAKLLGARGAKVVMAVQEPLCTVLRPMFPGVEIIRPHEVPAAFDYHCPIMSLPLAFGTTLETIPPHRSYIRADAQLSRAWAAQLPLPDKPRIGFVWSGNPDHRNDRNRSIDLSVFSSLFSLDAHWIALQKEISSAEREVLAQFSQVASCGRDFRDFSDTAAVIELLDLVVAVDTGVAHLAGAMGKPTWILLPFNADWRWLIGRDDSPWYPTARLFRQEDPRGWDAVFARVKTALQEFIQRRA